MFENNPETLGNKVNLPLLPKRSTFKKTGSEVSLSSNYFRFTFKNEKFSHFQKYAVSFEPELPGDAYLLRRKLYRQAETKISEKLGQCLFNNTTLYSKVFVPDPFEEVAENEGQSYKISIMRANEVDRKTTEALSIYKRFFHNSIKQLKFVEIKKSYFDRYASQQFDDGITLWTGFKPIINLYQQDFLLNLNMVCKIFRRETAFELLVKLRKSNTEGDLRESLNLNFKGLVVLTKYNNDKTYTIDSVNLDLTPMSTFNTKDGPVSYIDYYKSKYGIEIKEKAQPMLVVEKKSGNESNFIHLIPELCFLSGLTEEQRANFNLMKKINEVAIGTPNKKMEESKKLLQKILNNDSCKKEEEKWGMTIDFNPVELKGRKLNAGNLLLKNGSELVDIESTVDLDRKIQMPMYTQPPVNEWAVIVLLIFRLYIMEKIQNQQTSSSKHLVKSKKHLTSEQLS
jgi:aubergine-like protein